MRGMGGLAQFGKLRAELIKQAREAMCRRVIGRTNLGTPAIRFHDQIDRTILQMQPLAVAKERDLRKARHERRPGVSSIGRTSALSFSEASGRT